MAKDQHADVAVEGPEPYVKCMDTGFEKQGGQPGYSRFLRIRPGQTIEEAKHEADERSGGLY